MKWLWLQTRNAFGVSGIGNKCYRTIGARNLLGAAGVRDREDCQEV